MNAVLAAREPDARYLDTFQPPLVQHFDLLAAAPSGVATVRELIFNIAAAGKLVRSNHSVVPVTLGSVAEFVMGQAPPGNECNKEGRGTVFVKTGEFGARYPHIREWTTKPLKFANRGDVLVCVVGATIGKLNLAIDCAIGRSVAAIRPSERLDTAYLYYMLVPFTMSLRRNSRGSAQGVIGKTELNAILLRVPDLDEQARIVARIDELMRLCDALEARGQLEAEQHARLLSTLLGMLTNSRSPEELAANWQLVAAHFDLLLDRPEAVDACEQTMIQLAVRGLLVPQDQNEEPAKELLRRIRFMLDVHKAVNGETSSGAEFALPDGWEWARIDDLADVQGGIQKTQFRRPVKEHYPYLRVANVQRDALDLREVERFELAKDELAKWRLRAGDLLIVEGNGSETEIGRCAVWTGAIDPCVYQNHLIRVRCPEVACIEFIRLFLNSPSGRAEMKRLAITTSGLFNLSVGKIRNFVVPLPPLAEQRRIVARVNQLRRLCADLRQRLTAQKATHSRLAETLVASTTASSEPCPPRAR